MTSLPFELSAYDLELTVASGTAAEADTDGVEGAVVAAGTPDWSSSWVHPVAVTAITATRAGKILRIIDMSLLNSGCGHNDIAIPHPMTVADGLVSSTGDEDDTARARQSAPRPLWELHFGGHGDVGDAVPLDASLIGHGHFVAEMHLTEPEKYAWVADDPDMACKHGGA